MSLRVRCPLWLPVLAAAAGFLASPVTAQFTVYKLANPQIGFPTRGLGWSSAIHGNRLIAGAMQTSFSNATAAGVARIYRDDGHGNWALETQFADPNPTYYDLFGRSVAISQDTALVGASGFDNQRGAVYAFTYLNGTWTQKADLVSSGSAQGDLFGISVAIEGDTAVVGAQRANNSGEAYVFTRSNGVWTHQADLTSTDTTRDPEFGYSVAISGDTVVVGAPTDSLAGGFSGSAFVFIRANGVWTQQAKLIPEDSAMDDYFGRSVSIDGDTAIFGAPQKDNGTGAAYVFTRSDGVWTQQQKLVASDGTTGTSFGFSVTVSGNMAVVGEPMDRPPSHTGSAYVFMRKTGAWLQSEKLTAFDPMAEDQFGTSVAFSGNTLIVGAPWNDNPDFDSGAVYVYTEFPVRGWTLY